MLSNSVKLCDLSSDIKTAIEKIAVMYDDTHNELFDRAEPDMLAFAVGYDRCSLRGSIIYGLLDEARKIQAEMYELIKTIDAEDKKKAAAPVEGKATANIEPAQGRNPLPKYTPDSGTLQDISFKGCRRSIENSLKTAVALFHSHLSRSMFSQQLSLVSGKAIMAHELGAISRAELGELTVLIDEAEATGGHIA